MHLFGEKKWKKNKTKNVLKAVLLIKMSGDCLLMTRWCWKIQRPQRLVTNSERPWPVTVTPGARGTGAKVQGNLEAASMQGLRMTQETTPQSSWQINKERKHCWVARCLCLFHFNGSEIVTGWQFSDHPVTEKETVSLLTLQSGNLTFLLRW